VNEGGTLTISQSNERYGASAGKVGQAEEASPEAAVLFGLSPRLYQATWRNSRTSRSSWLIQASTCWAMAARVTRHIQWHFPRTRPRSTA